jgi:deoxyribose-phosphate aldolase
MRKIFSTYIESKKSIHNRLEDILADPITQEKARKVYVNLLGLLDMTTLEGSDTGEKVKALCEKSRFSKLNSIFPDAAAVCVYPSLVQTARKALDETAIKVASVAGGFPSGQTSLKVKLEEVRWAISEGADEIDTVISRGKLLEGKDDEVFDEIAAIRETCGNVHLKVILETGELPSVRWIRKASEVAIEAGADFIKTSTGKVTVGATPEAFLVMLDTIKEYLEKTGKAIGIKPAGGIRTPEQAQVYYRLINATLGSDWLNKSYFRIGASSLADALLANISVT